MTENKSGIRDILLYIFLATILYIKPDIGSQDINESIIIGSQDNESISPYSRFLRSGSKIICSTNNIIQYKYCCVLAIVFYKKLRGKWIGNPQICATT